MSLKRGPSITKDGLVMCVDAKDPSSYNGSGSTWTDVCGHCNASISNASYNSNGYFVLDGTDDYFIIDDAYSGLFADNTPFTVEIWAYKDTDNSNTSPMLMHYRGGSNYPSITMLAYGTNGNFSDYGSTMEADNDQDGDSSSGTSLYSDRNNSIDPDGAWSLFGLTYEGQSNSHEANIYFNGSNISTATSTASVVWKKPTSPYEGGPVIGSSAHSVGNTTHGFEGGMALIRIYSRALTPEEMSNNYNSQKSRFGHS